MTIRVPLTLETLWRSSGSKVRSVPDPASTTSPPRLDTRRSLNNHQPSPRRTMIARAPSKVSRVAARRVPSGASISVTSHVCMAPILGRSRVVDWLCGQNPAEGPQSPDALWPRDVGVQGARFCASNAGRVKGAGHKALELLSGDVKEARTGTFQAATICSDDASKVRADASRDRRSRAGDCG